MPKGTARPNEVPMKIGRSFRAVTAVVQEHKSKWTRHEAVVKNFTDAPEVDWNLIGITRDLQSKDLKRMPETLP